MALNVPAPDFNNAKSLEEKFNILADSYNVLRKELDYMLQNLSYDNFDTVSARNLIGKNIKGGNININDAFAVDKDGNVVMLGTLNIAGKITVDAEGNMTIYGGEMIWESSDPRLNDIDIELSNINGYLTDVNGELVTINGQLVGMNSELSDIWVVANLADTNIVKLSNGTYLGGTFINGKRIESPEIYGGKIVGIDVIGSKFHGDGSNSAYLIVGTQGGNYGDIKIFRGGSNGLTFWIYDEIGKIDLRTTDIFGDVRSFLKTTGETTQPQNKWDFSEASSIEWGDNYPTARFR